MNEEIERRVQRASDRMMIAVAELYKFDIDELRRLHTYIGAKLWEYDEGERNDRLVKEKSPPTR